MTHHKLHIVVPAQENGFRYLTVPNKKASIHTITTIYDISHTINRKSYYDNRVKGGGVAMNAKEAGALRINTLCQEHGLAVNALANPCGLAPSRIYSILNAKSQNPGIITVQKNMRWT